MIGEVDIVAYSSDSYHFKSLSESSNLVVANIV
jgi:hypothetical protein